MTGQVVVENSSAQPCDESALLEQAEFLLSALHLHPDCALAISLVDPDEMSELHERWMGEPGATDVLSFPMDELTLPGPGQTAEAGILGDIVICPQVALDQGLRAGHGLAGELALLLTHGVLHLLGMDHADPAEREAMFTLQAELISAWQAKSGMSAIRVPDPGVPDPVTRADAAGRP